MSKTQSVTSLAEAPEVDRKRRMIRYTVAMTIRVLCLILGMVVQGWLMWVFFAGAIFLPYFAVILANAGGESKQSKTQAVIEAPTLAISADAFREASEK
jgi:predicted tellurium resistance membrane protein TerC